MHFTLIAPKHTPGNAYIGSQAACGGVSVFLFPSVLTTPDLLTVQRFAILAHTCKIVIVQWFTIYQDRLIEKICELLHGGNVV